MNTGSARSTTDSVREDKGGDSDVVCDRAFDMITGVEDNRQIHRPAFIENEANRTFSLSFNPLNGTMNKKSGQSQTGGADSRIIENDDFHHIGSSDSQADANASVRRANTQSLRSKTRSRINNARPKQKITNSLKKILCPVCFDSITHFSRHIKTCNKHKDLEDKIPHITVTSNGSCYCDLCNCLFSTSIKNHCSSAIHVQNLQNPHGDN